MLALSLLALPSAFFFAVVGASPFPPTPSAVIYCDLAMRGPPIVASTNGTAVTGLQLAVDITPATLETSGFIGGWSFSNGGIGAFDGCHYWWLNISHGPHSYKPLSWAFDDQQTTSWNAAYSTVVKASATASYKATSDFLACKESGNWRLYLQTGTQKPPGEKCVDTQLYVEASTAIPI